MAPIYYQWYSSDNSKSLFEVKSQKQLGDGSLKILTFKDKIPLKILKGTYLYGAFDCMFLSCHVRVSE